MYVGFDDSRCDRIIFSGILLLLIFVPLLEWFSPVWSETIFEMGIFFLLALWTVDRFFLSGEEKVIWARAPINGMLILLLVLILLQIVPLPSAVISLLSPKTFSDKQEAANLISAIVHLARQDGEGMRVSYNSQSAIIEWLRLAGAAGLFFLTMNTARTRIRLEIVLGILICVGVFEAMGGAVGLQAEFYGNHGNANTYPGSLIFLFLVLAGLVLSHGIGHPSRSERQELPAKSFLNKIIIDGWRLKPVLVLVATTVMTIVLVLKASAGVGYGMAAGFISMSGLLAARKSLRKAGVAVGVAGFVLVFSSALLGEDPARHSNGSPGNPTDSYYHMALDYPILGVGAGNADFLNPGDGGTVNPRGQLFMGGSGWRRTAVEIGLPGAAILLFGMVLYIVRVISVWHTRRDRFALGVGIGVVGGITANMIYNLYYPGSYNLSGTMIVAVGMAMGYTAVHRRGFGFREKVFYKIREFDLSRRARIMVVFPVLLAVFFMSLQVTRRFSAELYCPTGPPVSQGMEVCGPDDIRKAMELNPGNGTYHYRLGITEAPDESILHLATAVLMNPADGVYWHALGKACAAKPVSAYDRLELWFPLADRCFEMALRWRPNDVGILFDVAGYWARRSRFLTVAGTDGPESISNREGGIRKFQRLFQRALLMDPELWKKAADRVWEYYPDDAVVMGIVPEGNGSLNRLVLRWLAGKGNENRKP